MLVNFATWAATHWKILMAITPVIGGGVFAVVDYTNGVDDRFDDMEEILPVIQKDVSETKCMLIAHHKGEEPLDCLLEEGL